MRRGLVVLLWLGASIGCTSLPHQAPPWSYPETRRSDQVDTYHGISVADPYRWLEDVDSAETQTWIAAQRALTGRYFTAIPTRDRLRRRLTELWDFERFTFPRKRGNRYFLSRNDGLQNQNVLFTLDGLDGTPRLLLDPNTLSADGKVSLATSSPSPDGAYLAYGLSTAGSDWTELRVREVATGRDLPEQLRWVKFSVLSWAPDGRGFYYSRYPEPDPAQKAQSNYFQTLYYHQLDTPQSADRLVYGRPEQKELGVQGTVTDDGRYLVLRIWQGAKSENDFAYLDLSRPDAAVVDLLTGFTGAYTFLDNDGPVFWFRTQQGAPRGRVIAIDLRQPDREHWREVIPQAAEKLQGVSVVGDRFVVRYLRDAHSVVKLFTLSGAPQGEVALPGLGVAGGFNGKRADRETFYSLTTFTAPESIYRYDFDTGKSTLFRRPRAGYDPDRFETRQVFLTSRDGTRLPMFLVHRKGLPLDGNNPTLLHAYGGFGVALTPFFSMQLVMWMDMGGVLAVANIRGGGEYGEEWHQAGIKAKKQNGFDDFAAAAEWLIAHRYTRPARLGISGNSNGGLLMGASLLQRPELFRAVVIQAGVLDMLRFPKFTIGWGWVPDYGSPDVPEEFRTLYAYSPVHNVRLGVAYPATLIATGDHDDRVVPGHSFKFAAALQRAQAGPHPVLLRIEAQAGHGQGTPISKQIEGEVDELAFFVQELGMRGPES